MQEQKDIFKEYLAVFFPALLEQMPDHVKLLADGMQPSCCDLEEVCPKCSQKDICNALLLIFQEFGKAKPSGEVIEVNSALIKQWFQKRIHGRIIMAEVTCLIDWSFNKPSSATSNQLLARFAMRSGFDLIIADRSIPLQPSENVILIGPPEEVHVPTWILALWTAEIIKERQLKKVVMVSEPQYLYRCKRDLKKALKLINYHCEISLARINLEVGETWFDPNGEQAWVNKEIYFRPREFAAYPLMPFLLYRWLSENEAKENGIKFPELPFFLWLRRS